MFCPNCGKEIPKESKFCFNCGAAINIGNFDETPSNTPSNAASNAPSGKPSNVPNYTMPPVPPMFSGNREPSFQSTERRPEKAPKTKRKHKGCLICVAVAVLIFAVFFSIGKGIKKAPSTSEISEKTSGTAKTTHSVSTSETIAEKDFKAEQTTNNENNISDYKVSVKKSFVTKDFDGKAVLVVTYTFKNNSSEKASWNYTIKADAFQDGIGLNSPISSWGIENYDFHSQEKDIMPGKSVDVQEAYYLDDNKTDVEIQLSLFSVWTDKVYDTFTIKIK